MIQSAVTISLVEEARGGPFVYWDGLADGCHRAAKAGFDAVELFIPSPTAVDPNMLKQLLGDFDLDLAAVGTGAGWVVHKLTLTHSHPDGRARARQYVRDVIDFAAQFNAPAIIGSMQGRAIEAVSRDMAIGYLGEALNELGERAAVYRQPLLYEPLNRYETNLFNRQADAAHFLTTLRADNVELLCDLFHMNIEESNLAAALREAGGKVGHIHFVDSNRHAAGFGHIDYAPIVQAIQEIHFAGFLSAEALPLPDSDAAAAQTMRKLRELGLVNG